MEKKIMEKKMRGLTVCLLVGFLLCWFGSGIVAATETLVIGGNAPLSGPAASWGIGQMNGTQMAVDEVNARGGLNIQGKRHTLQLICYDNKASPSEAISIVNKLVFSDKTKYILVAAVGATCRAIQTVTAPNNVFFSFSCWGKELLGPKVPLNFRFIVSPHEMSDVVIAGIKKVYPNSKTIATISPDDTSGWDGAKGQIRAAEKIGIKVVAEEYYKRDQVDFRATLSRILAKKPDLLDLGTSPMSSGGVILKQAYELGYRGPKTWIAGSMPEGTIKISGKEAAEDLFTVSWDYLSPRYTLSSLRDIVAQYKKKYGEEWDLTGIATYAGSKIVFSNMEKEGSLDPVTIAEAMVKNQPYETVFGPVIFGNESFYGLPRNMLFPQVLGRIKDGKLENSTFVLHPDLFKVVGDWKFPQ